VIGASPKSLELLEGRPDHGEVYRGIDLDLLVRQDVSGRRRSYRLVMVDRSGQRGTGVLVIAAVTAGVVAVALVALGFWLRHSAAGDGPRFTSIGWWGGVASQAVGYLAFGKAGFKVSLAAVLGTAGAVTWFRESRRRARETGEQDGGKIQNSP
jgi:hypothetical protein